MNPRNIYSPRERVQVVVEGPTMTKQAHKDECDINLVVERYAKGDMSVVNSRLPTYGDVSIAVEYREALDLVAEAEREFMGFPSKVRRLAGDNVEKFLQMLSNPEEALALQEAGLPLGIELEPQPPRQGAEAAAQAGTGAPGAPQQPNPEPPAQAATPADQ